MNAPPRPGRHRRDNRLIAAVAIAIFLVWGAVYLFQESGRPLSPQTVATRFPLFVLWYLDVTLIIATLFVICRALIKLALERRRGVLGSKFKTRLLVTLLGLTALPIGLLFLVATNLLQKTIDRWFSVPVETIANGAEDLRDLADRRVWDANAREAGALAQELRGSADAAALFRGDLARRRFDAIELYPPGGTPVRVTRDGVPVPPPYPSDQLAAARRRGSSQSLDLLPGGARWLRSAVATPRGVLTVGEIVSGQEAATGDLIARAWSDYRKLEIEKPTIQATSLLVFTLLTLGLLFGAIWIGLQLARRITAPVEALAESTRRIAEGDFSASVDVEATDELGMLVDSFNRMTAEIRDSRGRLERSNAELTAINARLSAERRLLAAILQTARTGIVAVDRGGTIHLANPAALEILGLEATPASLDALRPREDLAPLFDAVAQARPGALPPPRELSPAGEASARRAEVSVAAMADPEGEMRGYVIALEDTTEVARAQRLQAWTEAARRVAHEIKNPLTPIQLSAERMLKKLQAGDADARDAVRQGATTIIEEVQLLKSLVNQFSHLARMPEARPAPTDLPALAERTLALYDGARDRVTLELRNALPRAVYRLDPEQFQRALVNLIDNALEASPRGGCVELSLSERNGSLLVEVADEGAGIAPADRERIFLPDYSTKASGSGLGLAIVSRIVADHHGTIRFEPNRPRGSRFVIEIPAA